MNNNDVLNNWIPRKEVQAFFGYGPTKMSSFARDFNVKTTRVGKRVFYWRPDIERLLEEHTRKHF